MQSTTCLLATPSLFPLWDESTCTNLNPDYLPISELTLRRLNQWVDRFRKFTNHAGESLRSFQSQKEEFELEEEGKRLSKILQNELKTSHKIVYVSHVHGRVAEELFLRFENGNSNNVLEPHVLREEYYSKIEKNPADLCSRNSLAILLTEKFEDYEGARDQFEEVLRQDPYDSTACYNLAMLFCQKLDDTTRARELLEQALELAPDDLYARSCYGTLLMQSLDDPNGAIKEFENALDWDPGFEVAHFNLAVLHEKYTQNYSKARSHYEYLVNHQTREPVIFNNLANLLMHHFSEADEALKHLETALKLDDHIAEIHASKGVLMKDFYGAPARAAMSFSRAVEINPSDELSRLNLAEVSVELQDWEVAMEQLDALLRLNPGHALAHARIAEVYMVMGDFPKAKLHLETSLIHEEADPHTHNSLAILLHEGGGDIHLAREHWERAIEILENFPQAHLNLGTCMWREFGDLEIAAQHLKRAVELDSGCVDAHNHLALVYQSLGEFDSARNHFKVALRLDKKNPMLHENLANFHLMADQDYEQARIHFTAALSNGLDTPQVRYNLGLLMTQFVGDFQKGLEHFQRCIELNPEDGSSHQQLAKIYEEAFQNEAAAKYHSAEARRILGTQLN